MRVLESIPESLPCHAAGPGVFRQRWRRGWRWAEGARCCCCSRVMGPSSRGRCSPGRGSWSFAATPGWAGCSGWSCWKQWNASENRSPARPRGGHERGAGAGGCSHPSRFLSVGSSFSYFFVSFCLFLGPHPRHVEVPRLGVEWELQPPAYTTATATRDLSHVCDLCHSSGQHGILNPLSTARDRTCNLMVPSWIL